MARETLPSIVVTLADPRRSHDPAGARRRNELYLDAVRRSGGEPVGIDETVASDDAAAAFGDMEGLLLSGGTDLDPALYGASAHGSVGVRHERDRLELAAWTAALDRGLPVLGICRGLQAINVFQGGSLTQHVDGHQGPSFGEGRPVIHPLRLVTRSRLARIVADGAGPAAGEPSFMVNSYHHQAVRPADLAPGLLATAFAADGDAELVEALEARDDRWIVGVQFHPERVESTPPEFARLFAAFADAAHRARRGRPTSARLRRSAAGTAASAPRGDD